MADLPPPSDPPNGVSSENPGLSLGSKRQRRPSVRLGDIGEPSAAAALSYEAYLRRNKQWKVSGHAHLPPVAAKASTSSKQRRPLTNIGNGDSQGVHELIDSEKHQFGAELDFNVAPIGPRKGKEPKQKRGSTAGIKRQRSNWVSRVDEGIEGEDDKLSGDGIGNPGFQEYEAEGSETPSKEQSPNCSTENTAVDLRPGSDKAHGSEKEGIFPRKMGRGRVSEARDSDAVELEVPSDMDGGDWRCGATLDRNGGRDRCPSLDDGVRAWLSGLGLSRYAQVFEIHEVDDEVLPMLTLEDLKEMGINAVGSRRKMYCSIQKLRKGFS